MPKAKKSTVKWYVARKPSVLTHELYDIANSAVQAKSWLQQYGNDTRIGIKIHKTKADGGLYSIYIRKKAEKYL